MYTKKPIETMSTQENEELLILEEKLDELRYEYMIAEDENVEAAMFNFDYILEAIDYKIQEIKNLFEKARNNTSI